jgi:hypothetical protein
MAGGLPFSELSSNHENGEAFCRVGGSLSERGQAGLPEMVGSHEGQKVILNRENGRDRPKQSCYYAAL